MNNVMTFVKTRERSTLRAASIHFDFRFNAVLFLFVFWTLLQATMAMQFLPFGLMKEIEYLKAVLPAFVILICGFIYLDKLKVNNVLLPFVLFCLFVFWNASFHMIVTGVNDLKHLSQPVMFIVWTFCMFLLVPSVFDSIYKVRNFLRVTLVILVLIVLFSSIWSYSHEFEMYRGYCGSRGGGLRYSFVYLHPGYLGGICYSIVCGSLMLGELSKRRLEKKLLLLSILISLGAMTLASSRTYILGSFVLFLFYFWHKGGFFKKLSWIVLAGCVLFFLQSLWKLGVDENYLGYLNSRSSSRLLMWLNYWKDMMTDETGWKLLAGNGIYNPNWTQGIMLAEGKVVKSFTRLAIDNVYLEILIMQGVIGSMLFMWGLFRLFAKGNMFSRLKGMKGKGNPRILLSIAYGSLLGVLAGGFFTSHFPSVGNTINSIVFPASVAIIFIIRRHVQQKSKMVDG